MPGKSLNEGTGTWREQLPSRGISTEMSLNTANLRLNDNETAYYFQWWEHFRMTLGGVQKTYAFRTDPKGITCSYKAQWGLKFGE